MSKQAHFKLNGDSIIMSRNKKFPPAKLKDLDVQSASHFMSLLKDIDKNPITLVLGAGISSSVGLPDWRKLLEKACSSFFTHWEFANEFGRLPKNRPPTDLSIAFAEEIFWHDSAVELAKKLTENDVILVAQQIKNCIRDRDWMYLLRHALYDDINYTSTTSNLIESLTEICVENQNKVKAIINYNYDDLFEQSLKAKGLPYKSMWYGKKIAKDRNHLIVYHPHGISSIGGGEISNIIITESDYQQETKEPYSWANLVQLQLFSSSTCIFVGTSMTDPNIRRLLRISSSIFPNRHYTFLSTKEVEDDESKMFDSLFDYDLIKLGVKTIRYKIQEGSGFPPHSKLPELIRRLNLSLRDKNYILETD